jgi:hypothetical protein
MLNDNVIELLKDWKFQRASAYADEQTEPLPTEAELLLIESLARVFGNTGWFSGDMARIVGAAVSTLLPKPEDRVIGPRHAAVQRLLANAETLAAITPDDRA